MSFEGLSLALRFGAPSQVPENAEFTSTRGGTEHILLFSPTLASSSPRTNASNGATDLNLRYAQVTKESISRFRVNNYFLKTFSSTLLVQLGTHVYINL